jgi:transcriptional regulator with XRE-family HTH domain
MVAAVPPSSIDPVEGRAIVRSFRAGTDAFVWELAGQVTTLLANYERGRRPIKLAHLEAIAVVLHRSPAAFLVDSDEAAAIVEQIVGNQERCLHMLFFLDALTEQPDAADPATESQAS